MQISGPRVRFDYYTEASNLKLQKWISISLKDIGIDPKRNADVRVRSGKNRDYSDKRTRPKRQRWQPFKVQLKEI